MTTDRELLELAAKATGLRLTWTGGGLDVDIPTIYSGLCSDTVWNPLTDDGDALRLVVTLGLTVNHWSMAKRTWAGRETDSDGCTEPHGSDPGAATRRAIVRAAAEIGRNMK